MTVDAVHIVERMAPGGIETLVLDLVRDGGATAKVYSLAGTVPELVRSWPLLAGLELRLVAFDRKPGVSLALAHRVWRQIRRDRPRVVIAHHIGPILYGGIAARAARTPALVHVEHDAWHLEMPSRRRLTRIVQRILAPRHVAVSGGIAEALRRIVPAARIDVIANGIDLDRFRPGERAMARARLGLAASSRLVGAVGRLLHLKGQDVLVRAVPLLPADVHIAIVGDGEQRRALAALADDLGVAGRIHFLGHRDDVPKLLPAFDAFCLPSRAEGLPRSVIEAQACGVPVVASDVGSLREAVCPTTGRLVPADSPAALADALRQVLEGRTACSPREFIAASFDWAATRTAYAHVSGLEHAA